MKKAIAIILAAGMMLAMAACGATPASSTGTSAPAGSSSAQGQATRTYFINPKMVGAAYWETAKEGAMQAGEDLGVEVIWNGTSEVDVAKQINMVTDMITRQVDGIAVAVNDATSMTNVFNQAKEASIPVVTFDSDSENAERAYCILPDTDEAIGEAFLAALINQMPEPKGKVAVMIASPSAANIIAWRDAALAKIEKDYPDIEIVGVYPSNDDQQKAYENAKSFIQANPDLSGILCLAAAETPAACKAVQEAVEAGQLEEGQHALAGARVFERWHNVGKRHLEPGQHGLSGCVDAGSACPGQRDQRRHGSARCGHHQGGWRPHLLRHVYVHSGRRG